MRIKIVGCHVKILGPRHAYHCIFTCSFDFKISMRSWQTSCFSWKSTFLITTRSQQTQYNYLPAHRLLLTFLYGTQQSTFKFLLFQWLKFKCWLTFRYSKSPLHDVHKHEEQSHGTLHPVKIECIITLISQQTCTVRTSRIESPEDIMIGCSVMQSSYIPRSPVIKQTRRKPSPAKYISKLLCIHT